MLSTGSNKSLQYKISQIRSMWAKLTDRQTDMTKPNGTFRDYANTLINSMRHSLLYGNEQIT